MNQARQVPAVVNASAGVTELRVTGMTCNNCARSVTEAIQSVPGVRSASVALDGGRVSVRWAADVTPDLASVLNVVKQAGFDAKAVDAVGSAGNEPASHAGWHVNLWLGVITTLPLMVGEWILGLGLKPWFQWSSFALAGMVQVIAGAPFYRGAWRQLKRGRSNMDTLVALGSSTAFGYSAWAMLSGHGGHVYFMEAAAIITLISVGHWLEARVSARASSALKSLLHLAPPTARRVGVRVSAPPRSSSGFNLLDAKFTATAAPPVETEVPLNELKAGDLVVLRPGDRVPVDGAVVEGDSAVDESMLTGESVPVDKSPGQQLYAGTVNVNGRLLMRVTATGEATALAHIIAAVQRAQTSRANIQRLGDRVSNIFVPLVVLVAIAAGLWWGVAPESAELVHNWFASFLWPAHPPFGQLAAAFIIAAAVLIIACPCAMGLATPAAIMASANAAARRGILIRDGVALEKAGGVTAVIFDKTGTLTSGTPKVVSTWEASQLGAGSVPVAKPGPESEAGSPPMLRLAAALARHSTHPVSQAVATLSSAGTLIADWKEIRGAGVEGNIQPAPGRARLGSLIWLRESKVDLAAGESFTGEWTARGATVVGVAVDKTLIGLFAVQDTLKSGAVAVVEQLQRQGLKPYLLTGDNVLTAASIAKQSGIAPENVFAEVRPEQKAEFVRRLQTQGERVAFVGDGINDAPALEQADLGIAVSRASDIAREAADIILLRSDIDAVPEALGLAKATLRTIKQNLFWAFFYNAVGVPLAALGFMSPILCAAAMGFSDLIVIGNALRLRHWQNRM